MNIDGMLQDAKPAGAKVTTAASAKIILRSLSTEPKMPAELARDLNIDPAACEAVLTSLVKQRLVERDAGFGKSAVYRAVVKAERSQLADGGRLTGLHRRSPPKCSVCQPAGSG